MQLIREIRKLDSDTIVINIPKKYMKKKVEIIVSSIEQADQQVYQQKKLRAVDELNGLISDQSKKKLQEFDRVVSQRIPLRRKPIQL
jgi:hypothetical protein